MSRKELVPTNEKPIISQECRDNLEQIADVITLERGYCVPMAILASCVYLLSKEGMQEWMFSSVPDLLDTYFKDRKSVYVSGLFDEAEQMLSELSKQSGKKFSIGRIILYSRFNNEDIVPSSLRSKVTVIHHNPDIDEMFDALDVPFVVGLAPSTFGNEGDVRVHLGREHHHTLIRELQKKNDWDIDMCYEVVIDDELPGCGILVALPLAMTVGGLMAYLSKLG